MSKNIVLCLDGTGNKFKEDNSNIVKIARVLTKDPQNQMIYYDPGVGTLANPRYRTNIFSALSKIKGLALGRGIKQDIKEAYAFLMNNYEDGDRIFIFGFSRGAYTARSIAGLIEGCGLLEKGNTNLLPYALNMYTSKKIDFKVLAKFKHTFGRKCDIELLGLFDTVRSLGSSFNPLFYPFTENNRSVKAVRHALAIDEKRVFFKPLLWGNKYQKKQNIKEVWFSGVHSDIGGGYPEKESGLAKIALKWMIDEATSKPFNLIKDNGKYNYYVLGENNTDYIAPDNSAVMHNSLKGFWKASQFLPIAKWNDVTDTVNLHFAKPDRKVDKESVLYASVFERLENHSYAPSNLDLGNIDIYRIEK